MMMASSKNNPLQKGDWARPKKGKQSSNYNSLSDIGKVKVIRRHTDHHWSSTTYIDCEVYSKTGRKLTNKTFFPNAFERCSSVGEGVSIFDYAEI